MNGSWALEDLLLFEPRVYWRLFALENEAFWPAQPALLAAGAVLAACLLSGRRPSGRWLGPALGAAWLWTGWQFVSLRYGTVNWAAPTLAWGFLAEAALLAAFGLSGRFALERRRSVWPGAALLVSALFAWPLLAPLDGRPWSQAEIVAVAPDPTAIATLGLLALAARNRWTLLLSVLPAAWLAVSALTLFAIGAWQGWAVLAALAAGLASASLPRR